MSSILQKLKLRREKAALSAEQQYQQLIQDIWAGNNVEEVAAETILQRAGKSDDDLAKALQRLDKLKALEDLILTEKDQAAVKSEMRTLRGTIDAEVAALAKQKQHVAENSVKLQGRIEKLRAQLDASAKAQGELRKLTNWKPPQDIPPERIKVSDGRFGYLS